MVVILPWNEQIANKKHTTQDMIHHIQLKFNSYAEQIMSVWKYQLLTAIYLHYRLCFQESGCQECSSLRMIWLIILITFGGSPNLLRLESHCSSVGQIVTWPRDAGMQNHRVKTVNWGSIRCQDALDNLTNLQDFTYLHLIRLHHMTWCFIAYEGTRVPNHGLGNVYGPVQSNRVPERCQKHHV